MFAFINQFFAALSSLFSAAQKGGESLDILASVAKQKAKAYHDEEQIKINARLRKLQADAAKDPQLVIDAE